MKLQSVAALAIVAVLTAGAARAETIHFAATLTGADEVPPNNSAGRGELTAEVEPAERVLAYRVTYSGLSGPAIAAHFHGPAAPGADAPPQVTVSDLGSPMGGSVRLTQQQVEDVLAGKWYFNIHTQAHPTGEIRGQLKRLN